MVVKKLIVIDNKHNVTYRCCKEDAAKIVGISSRQISRWIEKAKLNKTNREIFNNYEVIFTEFVDLKVNTGFGLKK